MSDTVRAGALVVALLVAGVVGGVVPRATAADNPALFDFEPDELEADPGETVSVDVVLQGFAGYGGEEIRAVEFAVEYDSTVLTATDVDRGPWLEGDEAEASNPETSIDVSTEIDDANGSARISQTRVADDEGVTGIATVATITFEVADDASPTTVELTTADRTVRYVGDHLSASITREGQLLVDGGDSDGDEDDDESDRDSDGVILADEDDSAAGGDDGDEDTDGDGNDGDSIPGFGVAPALWAIAVFTLLGSRLTWR